jgi:hypothetical protein
MRRLIAFVSLFVVLTAAVASTHGAPATAAQDASMATHPVVGAWKYVNESFTGDGESFPSVGVFHADGTYTEVLPWGAVLVGAWEPTGERTANLLFRLNDIIDDKIVEGEGRATIEVDETGNSLSMMGNFISLYEDGTVDMAVESPSTGTRLKVLPMVPLGTPVIPPDVAAAAGTPAS